MKKFLFLTAALVVTSGLALAQNGPGSGTSSNYFNHDYTWSNNVSRSYDYDYDYLWGTNHLALTNVPFAWSNYYHHTFSSPTNAGKPTSPRNRLGKPTPPADVQTIVQQFEQDRTRLMSQLKTSSDGQRRQILREMDQLRTQMRDQISKIRDDARQQAEQMRHRFANNRDEILNQGAGNAGANGGATGGTPGGGMGRDWRIYHDLVQTLIAQARRLYASEPFGVDLSQTVYALDSTTIDLCLSLFPWARFRSTKAAIKLHTLLDLRGPIPTMIAISHGKQADVGVLDELMLEPGAFYVMDRGYVDFARLYRFVLAGAFFVTRAKTGLQINRLESRPVQQGTGVRSDKVVWLKLTKSIEHYPDRIRRVSYTDPETGKSLVFLTNNFDLPALTIAQLYKCRWRVELFFK